MIEVESFESFKIFLFDPRRSSTGNHEIDFDVFMVAFSERNDHARLLLAAEQSKLIRATVVNVVEIVQENADVACRNGSAVVLERGSDPFRGSKDAFRIVVHGRILILEVKREVNNADGFVLVKIFARFFGAFFLNVVEPWRSEIDFCRRTFYKTFVDHKSSSLRA